jgi:GDPmannose 4,6-dehydratase
LRKKKSFCVKKFFFRDHTLKLEKISKYVLDKQIKKTIYVRGKILNIIIINSKNIEMIKPDEIYNLGAQSHVKVSFDVPEYTANVDALGTLRILDSIKILKLQKKIKFYQAGTAEMFGSSLTPQNEKTQFKPSSPYAVAKLYAHWITKNYRDAYGIFASNGILFNHESPLRGETFVTKKIVKGLCNILNGKQTKIFLGNLYSKRDWGHAEDYVEAMWKILQHKKPDDFVIATGKQMTVKEFINKTAKYLGLKLVWKGEGFNEIGLLNGKKSIFIDKRYFRPIEVDSLQGNSRYAQKLLKWKPKKNIDDLIIDMINYEIK